MAENVFKLFDWDDNGRVSFNEFKFAILANSNIDPNQKLYCEFWIFFFLSVHKMSKHVSRNQIFNTNNSLNAMLIIVHVVKTKQIDVQDFFINYDLELLSHNF